MDSLANYQAILSQFGAEKAQIQAEGEAKLQEMKEKLRDFTDPWETLGAESAGRLFVGGTKGAGKAVLNKLGLTEEKAQKLKKAYDTRGTRGVLQELAKDKPLYKGSPLPPATPPRETKANIEDLLPEDFQKVKDAKYTAMREELGNLPADKEAEYKAKMAKRYVKDLDEFGGDNELKKQYNLGQARRTLDEVKTGEEPPLSINGLSKSDYADPTVRDALKSSVKSEYDDLHPVLKDKVNGLMRERKALPKDIDDDILREKFNLHQLGRSLDDVKTMNPAQLATNDLPVPNLSQLPKIPEPPTLARQTIQNVNQALTGDDDSSGILQQGRSVTNVFKSNIAEETSKLADANKALVQSAEKVGKGALKDAAEEGGEKALKVATETGGEEDPIGDVIGAVAGISSFLGGLFGARHLHQPAVKQISNIGYQMGA
jgi:hypothetical protein